MYICMGESTIILAVVCVLFWLWFNHFLTYFNHLVRLCPKQKFNLMLKKRKIPVVTDDILIFLYAFI